MIRIPPSAVALTQRDIDEHLAHVKQEQEAARARAHENAPLSRQPNGIYASASVLDSQSAEHQYFRERSNMWGPRDNSLFNSTLMDKSGIQGYPLDSRQYGHYLANQQHGAKIAEHQAAQQFRPDPDLNTGRASPDLHCDSDEEEGYVSVSSLGDDSMEVPIMFDPDRSPVPPPASLVRLVENQEAGLSPFGVLDPAPAPRSPVTTRAPRPFGRSPLPPSSLSIARGVDSPEKPIMTSSINPVSSPAGIVNTEQRPRAYRRQSISFSEFGDELSDDESTDYQVHENNIGAVQMDPGTPGPVDLFGRYRAQASSFETAASSRSSQAELVSPERRQFYFSSPQLDLPPPFSTVPRTFDSEQAMPSRTPSPAASPRHARQVGVESSPGLPAADMGVAEQNRGAIHGSYQNLSGLPHRLLVRFRARSPIPTPLEEPYPPRPWRHSSPGGAMGYGFTGEGPDRPMRIYNDHLPASGQPQTPDQLREARHVSRRHPSYTMPTSLRRVSAQSGPASSGRARARRTDSPPGLNEPGFHGLYGGRENGDEEVLFEQASQRLFSASSTGRQSRALSSTPEPELA